MSDQSWGRWEVVIIVMMFGMNWVWDKLYCCPSLDSFNFLWSDYIVKVDGLVLRDVVRMGAL